MYHGVMYARRAFISNAHWFPTHMGLQIQVQQLCWWWRTHPWKMCQLHLIPSTSSCQMGIWYTPHTYVMLRYQAYRMCSRGTSSRPSILPPLSAFESCARLDVGLYLWIQDTAYYVKYNGKIILWRTKDPSTYLWVLLLTPKAISESQRKLWTSQGNDEQIITKIQLRAGPSMAHAPQSLKTVTPNAAVATQSNLDTKQCVTPKYLLF